MRREVPVRRFHILLMALLVASTAVQAQAQEPIDNSNVPTLPFEVVPNFLKYPPTMNLGEVLGVAVNSVGTIMVLNHPGSATTGPLYDAATTQAPRVRSHG